MDYRAPMEGRMGPKTGRINRRTVCLMSNNKHGKSLTRRGGYISACMSVCELMMG